MSGGTFLFSSICAFTRDLGDIYDTYDENEQYILWKFRCTKKEYIHSSSECVKYNPIYMYCKIDFLHFFLFSMSLPNASEVRSIYFFPLKNGKTNEKYCLLSTYIYRQFYSKLYDLPKKELEI